MQTLDSINLEILWGRLIAMVDEAAATVVRTSFSSILRESHDYAFVLLDTQGRAMAQSNQGVPALATVCPRTVRSILSQFDISAMAPGDVFMTNDPWLGAGHLPDFFTVMPVFRKNRLVAFAAAVGHMADVGGLLAAADAREVFEEGICFPPVQLFHKGKPDKVLMSIIERNVRVPDQVVGDINALVASQYTCSMELQNLMDEAGIDDLGPLASEIIDRCERSMRSAISAIPDGVYRGEVETDGGDHHNHIKLAMHVHGSDILADYTGTSAQVRSGINSVLNYTFGHTAFALKCILDPFTPNSEGGYAPLKVKVPRGTLLNPDYPAPVYARNQTGHYLAALIMSALGDVIPEKVMAAGGTPMNRTVFAGPADPKHKPFSFLMFTSGGMGGMMGQDGLSNTAYPSNADAVPIEITETLAPITVWHKQLRTDSGGAGKWRGGLGVEIKVENTSGRTLNVSTRMDRIHHPPPGLYGGKQGSPAGIWRNGTDLFPPKGRGDLKAGEFLVIHTAGGGGFGQPNERDRELIREDLRNELVSRETAQGVYGWEEAE